MKERVLPVCCARCQKEVFFDPEEGADAFVVSSKSYAVKYNLDAQVWGSLCRSCFEQLYSFYRAWLKNEVPPFTICPACEGSGKTTKSIGLTFIDLVCNACSGKGRVLPTPEKKS